MFDDNLVTLKWKNYVDYLIIFMILLSTTEVFISTFDVSPTLRVILNYIDTFTLILFTIEVALRVWSAPLLFEASSPWRARLRYCTSFYGILDLLSTLPFYLQWLIPLPVQSLKVFRTFRVVRLFRITRYMKSFRLLSSAISSKRTELIISLQFLIIITVILSLILYFAEHNAQPDVYNNGFVSVIWAFAQYIGDPGEFASTPPITFIGRVIACLVGILGIAIVAVPAGIITAGFTESLEDYKHQKKVAADAANLRNAFQRKLDRPTGYQIVPRFRTLEDVMALLNMRSDNLNDAVAYGPGFRLVNLASTLPPDQYASDRIAIEHYPQNCEYGCFIDRGSSVTIINTSAYIDAGTGLFSFYLALFGGFNYISREIGTRAPTSSFYTFDNANDIENLPEFVADLETLLNRPNGWGISILSASGALEPSYPTHIHLTIGGKKGDTRMAGDDLTVHDEATYRSFYDDFVHVMKEKFDLLVDHQAYHNSNTPRLFLRKIHLNSDVNNVMIRIDWSKLLWDTRRILFIKSIAEMAAKHLAKTSLPDNESVLKKKSIGYDNYGIEPFIRQ